MLLSWRLPTILLWLGLKAAEGRLEVSDTVAARITHDYTSAIDATDSAKRSIASVGVGLHSDRAILAGSIRV